VCDASCSLAYAGFCICKNTIWPLVECQRDRRSRRFSAQRPEERGNDPPRRAEGLESTGTRSGCATTHFIERVFGLHPNSVNPAKWGERERKRQRERKRKRERQRERDRERQRETERDRERQRETERERDKDREKQRERAIERQAVKTPRVALVAGSHLTPSRGTGGGPYGGGGRHAFDDGLTPSAHTAALLPCCLPAFYPCLLLPVSLSLWIA
jgi:hypothetical protein